MKVTTSTMDKNPVVRTAQWIMSLMKNKLIASLLLLIQGILFLAAPTGDMQSTVVIAAVIIILACGVNIGLHLFQKKRTALDYALAIANAAAIIGAVFCLINPTAVEPYVRILAGVFMILVNAVNLIETIRLEEKKDWKYVVGIFVSVFLMGLGVMMVFADELRIAIMQRGIGAFLVLNAVLNIWYLFRLNNYMRKSGRPR